MSVDMRTYVLWGVILPMEAVEEGVDKDAFERCHPYHPERPGGAFELNPKGNITVLYDGMSCNYIAVGFAYCATAEHDGFDAPVTIPNAGFAMAHEPELTAALADLGVERTAHAAGWHIISHYS